MPRIARLIAKEEPAVYRVMSRAALDGYVMGDVEKEFLLNLIMRLSNARFGKKRNRETILGLYRQYKIFRGGGEGQENQLPEKEFRKIRREKRKYTRIVEEIIEEGISQGLFRKSDPKLQAFALIGMCNWVYKWYKPGPGSYTPVQIADYFVSLLERGYLKGDTEGMPDVRKSLEGGKEKAGSRMENYQQLRAKCTELSALIDEMEKHG